MSPRCLIAAALVIGAAQAYAADAPSGSPMKMDEPMHGEMRKPNMKKGDVKKAAEKKKREMKPAIEKESTGAAKK